MYEYGEYGLSLEKRVVVHGRVRVMLQLRAHMGRTRVSEWISLLYSHADPFKMDRWDMGIRDRHGQEQRSFMQKMQLQPCI